jgi:hypothetical protein
MKRNSSLCFLVNIGRSLFAALRSIGAATPRDSILHKR